MELQLRGVCRTRVETNVNVIEVTPNLQLQNVYRRGDCKSVEMSGGTQSLQLHNVCGADRDCRQFCIET